VTDVTTGHGQEPVELSAADEQVLRELTERPHRPGCSRCPAGEARPCAGQVDQRQHEDYVHRAIQLGKVPWVSASKDALIC
jgi:hypothetical protein